jgi:hypothetical protein
MKDEDVKQFLEDFKKADINKKLDMWFFALDQEALWEEMLDQMSLIARKQQIKEAKMMKKKN